MADAPAEPDTGETGETPSAEPEAPSPEPPATEDKDWKAEAEKWQTQARKHEQRAKSNASAAKELETLRASMMSETEKAVAEAEARGRQTAVTEVGRKLASAEIKAALSGVVADPLAIIEDLDLGRYVTEDGDVDLDAVASLSSKLSPPPAPEPPKKNPGRPDEALRAVPLQVSGEAAKTDMNEWMRSRESNS